MFRKLMSKRDNTGNIKFVASARVIGKHKASSFGVTIAEILGLSDPPRYTGHCFKRTSITWMADSGMTAEQMMTITCKSSLKSHQFFMNSLSFTF